MLRYLLLAVLFAATTYPQSVHQQHQQEFGLIKKQKSLYPENGEGILPLQFDKSRLINNAIFGYLPDWEYTNRAYLRYDILTHIAAFDFTVNSSGNITNPSYWPWTDIINTAHSNGVKVILTAVCFTDTVIHKIMTDATVKANFFNNLKTRMQQYSLDGVNIDFESLASGDRGTLLTSFFTDLTNYIKLYFPQAEISFAGPALTSGYNTAAIANVLDYIFIMGYDFYGSWSSTTGPSAPLTGGSINITNTVTTQWAAVTNTNPRKLILGVPYFGAKWRTKSDVAHAQVAAWVSSTRFKDDVINAPNYGLLWASDNQTPWYRYMIDTNRYQVWFDNDSSLGLKYSLAQAKNYYGVGMWALCYDGARPELWNELRKRYYPPAFASGEAVQPLRFGITGNYPNPFNPSTIITFTIIDVGAYTVQVFTSAGELVYKSEPFYAPAGTNNHRVDLAGRQSGIYFVVLTGNKLQSRTKIALIK